VKDKNPFSPAEDAAMIYLLENLGGSRRDLLRGIFGRSHGNVNIRRDELYGYRYAGVVHRVTFLCSDFAT
jgi:hypothetical protein